MLSESPVSTPDGLVDPADDRSVERELQARREDLAQGISRPVVWVCGAVSIMLLGVWFLAPSYSQILIYAVLMLLLALGAGLYPVLQRRNRTSTGLFLVFGPILAVVLLVPLLIPSLMPAVGIVDVIAMMVAFMLRGDRGSRWLVGVLALAYLADVVVVSILGWSPFPPLEHGSELWVSGTVSLVVMLTAVLIIRLIVLGQEQQFRRAQRLNLELERQIQAVNETQATLHQERNLLRLLIDTIPANVYVKDTHSRFVEANLETALQMGAETPGDLLGKTDFDFFTLELAAKYFADEQAILRSGQPMLNSEEANFDRRTQQNIRFLTTKVPILNEQGAVTGLVGVGLGITERTRAQEQVARERDLLRTLIDQLPDDIFVKDADGRFINSNSAYNRIARVKDAAELSGKSVFDVFPAHLAAQFHTDDQSVLDTGEALVNVERTSLDAQGQERTVLTTKVPLRDASGQVTGLVGINRDITEHIQAEQQLLALTAERQRVHLLGEFIKDISHDIRTPLTLIGTSVFLVGKTTDPVKLTQYRQRIEEQVSRLRLLLDSFVELTQLEQETSSVRFQPTEFNSVVTTVLERCKPQVVAKQQHLEYQCETSSALVLADPSILSKAITNVVENAVRYTPDAGQITLHLYQDRNFAVVAVANTGIGIQAADLPHIFESFYRADSARSMKSGGAGLGLSIAKKIVELMSGHIEVQSDFGHGCVFRIYLPLCS